MDHSLSDPTIPLLLEGREILFGARSLRSSFLFFAWSFALDAILTFHNLMKRSQNQLVDEECVAEQTRRQITCYFIVRWLMSFGTWCSISMAFNDDAFLLSRTVFGILGLWLQPQMGERQLLCESPYLHYFPNYCIQTPHGIHVRQDVSDYQCLHCCIKVS